MTRVWNRAAALLLTAALLLGLFALVPAQAKTIPAGQTVETVLFYVTNQAGEEILVSQLPVSEMEADLEAGLIDGAVHNYSVLDRYVTPVHLEAQGFTVPEFLVYAQSRSDAAALRSLPLTFDGGDEIAFWEIDQGGFDDTDAYTYDELYGTARYNFPLLYQYWDYRTQDYYDPAGEMTREEVIDYIFANGEPAVFLLSVRAFSQRYMITEGKYGAGDYNMENYWSSTGRLDSERTIRMMLPMTEEDLYQKNSTAADTRYWVATVRLEMEQPPALQALGAVEAPSAVMTEDEDNYYIRFSCGTDGATIYYNHNFISPSYAPTARYDGSAVVVSKELFPNGTVTVTARAVKDGWTDAGMVTLTLTASGQEEGWSNPFSDVSPDAWYYEAVEYAVVNGLFSGTSETTFAPEDAMTRAMFVTVMSNAMGADVSGYAPGEFADVTEGDWFARYVSWAAQTGLVAGTGGGQFSPDEPITLEQMAAILYQDAGAPAVSGGLPEEVGTVSGWAESAMRWAGEAGLLDGVGGALSAQGGATRAQVAQMMMNYCERMEETA